MTPNRLTWIRKPNIPLVVIVGSCALAISCTAPAPNSRRSATPISQPEPPAQAGIAVAEHILTAHNAERTRRRLAPLTLNPLLTTAATAHAVDMADRGKMAHRGGDGSSPFDRIERVGYSCRAAGENVAYGYDNVDSVMAGWMRSPGHRRNILGGFTEIGVGRVIAPAGVSYWCVTFGTPSPSVFR